MYPTTNLQPGSRGSEVSELQQFLLEQGFLTAEQIATGPGVYGPQTTSAVKQWQEANGVENTSGPGYWGPRSIQTAGGVAGEGAQSQAEVDAMYEQALAGNPAINSLRAGGSSLEEIINALSTGDLSGIVDGTGQPFSAEAQQEALAKATEDNRLYYEALQQKETTEAEAKLAEDQASYQDYLIGSGQAFESDKSKADLAAAKAGMLFSGSRVQREKNMKRAYEQDQAIEQRKLAGKIGATASDFQYKYGTQAAQGLNKYYGAGGNVYNPNVARGGVEKSGISSFYDPSSFDYQGIRKTERASAANVRAAAYLKNKGTKLLGSGYTNQL